MLPQYPLLIKLRGKVIAHADKFLVLDLTIYEVGNIIWKEYRREKIKLVAEDQDLLKFPESISIDTLLKELISHKEDRN